MLGYYYDVHIHNKEKASFERTFRNQGFLFEDLIPLSSMFGVATDDACTHYFHTDTHHHFWCDWFDHNHKWDYEDNDTLYQTYKLNQKEIACSQKTFLQEFGTKVSYEDLIPMSKLFKMTTNDACTHFFHKYTHHHFWWDTTLKKWKYEDNTTMYDNLKDTSQHI